MELIKFIEENYDEFTNKEKNIADFLFKSKESIVDLSAKEIGEKTNTSGPTVVRFAKKIGFSSLNELKVKISANIENKEKEKRFEYLSDELTTKNIILKIKETICGSVDKTTELLSEEEVERGIEVLSNCKNINIFGIGSSSIVGQDLYHKLARIGKRATYCADSHLQVSTSVLLEQDDVALVISYSGETKEMLECARNAKKKGSTVIAITKASLNNPLEKLSDIVLKIAPKERELREGAISSMISEIAIIDILFLGIAKNNMKEVENRLIKTRDAIKELKKKS